MGLIELDMMNEKLINRKVRKSEEWFQGTIWIASIREFRPSSPRSRFLRSSSTLSACAGWSRVL